MRNRNGQGQRTLPEIAMDLVATARGSLERPDRDQQADVRAVEHALRTWTPSERGCFRFDAAVRDLCRSALVEVQSRESALQRLRAGSGS